MASDMVNHSFGLDQTSKDFSLHFTLSQWQKFWNLLIVGSAMAESLATIEEKIVLQPSIRDFSRELVEKWIDLSRELILVWESGYLRQSE